MCKAFLGFLNTLNVVKWVHQFYYWRWYIHLRLMLDNRILRFVMFIKYWIFETCYLIHNTICNWRNFSSLNDHCFLDRNVSVIWCAKLDEASLGFLASTLRWLRRDENRCYWDILALVYALAWLVCCPNSWNKIIRQNHMFFRMSNHDTSGSCINWVHFTL
jgi:hypothetical protein